MGTYGPKATSAPVGAIILHPGDDISAIVDAAPAGATFYFEPGVYRGVSLAPKDGQVFIGAEGAILNGSAVLTDWTRSGDLWVIDGQTQQGRVHPNAEFEPGTERPGYPETVFFDNTPLKPVDDLSKVVPGTFYFDYAADRIYIADDPTGHTVEAGKLSDAFHGSATNVTVQNLVIEKYDPQIQDGAIRGGEGWIIRDNEVRLNYAVGITARDGSQIVGNYVHDNGQMGLGGSGNNILIQGNEIARNGFWSGIDPLWEGGGLKFSNTDNLVVRGNYAHDNKGTGMWTDTNNIHTLYEDNVVAHNTINGISHEISYDAIIRNNTLIGNGYGDTRGWAWGSEINIQNSQNVEVYGNRIDMTGGGNGIVLIQQDRGSGTYGPYTTTGNQIHDNIIVDRDGHGYIGGFADYNLSGMLDGGNTWSNNQYFMSDEGGRFQWIGYKTFAQFKDATHETGPISQSYPDTSGWLTGSPADPMSGITLTGDGTLIGGPGNDDLNGGAGIDSLDGGAGADVMTGGGSDDTYYVDNANDVVNEAAGGGIDTVHAGTDWTMTAGQQIEVLRAYGAAATSGITLTANDLGTALIGGSGNDHLNGGAGIDFLDGGAGADVLAGGGSDDTYTVDNADDVVNEDVNQGTDLVRSLVSFALAGNLENLTLTGTGNIDGTGNGLANTLLGNSGDNVLDGGAGADAMQGSWGNDTYIVDNAGDVVFEDVDQGTDTVKSSVSFTLAGNLENLTLTGTGTINGTGNGLANTLLGNAGSNVLDGGLGADTMRGSLGNDTYIVDNTGDVVLEDVNQGTDTVKSSVSFTLGYNLENLTLTGTGTINGTGNSLANTLFGNAANNTLDGKSGNDVLAGGAGKDVLTGGTGNDAFVFDTALGTSNIDRITDFNVTNDTIWLDNAVFAALAEGTLAAGAFYRGSAAHDADDRIIYNAATGALIYDSNGNAPGGAVQIATVNAGLAITYNDFLVI